MKTFLTEKHNIPEGATHYSDSSDERYFSWFMHTGDEWFIQIWSDKDWVKCKYNEQDKSGVKPIPQTNIETPEEREALDLIDTTPQQYENIASKKAEWDGKGLPPVGCKIKTKHGVSEVLSTSDWDGGVVTYSYDDGVSIGCAWNNKSWVNPIETPQQREERERLEAAYDLYLIRCNAVNHPIVYDFHEFKSAPEAVNGWLAVVDKTNYRKESE